MAATRARKRPAARRFEVGKPRGVLRELNLSRQTVYQVLNGR